LSLPIYSKLIVSAPGLAVDSITAFPLDPVNTTVIHTMDAFLAGLGGGYVQAWDTISTTFWYVAEASDSTGLWLQWRGRQVFDPGGTLYFKGSVLDPLGHMDFRASGYVLTP
jgi:hypothetical protein